MNTRHTNGGPKEPLDQGMEKLTRAYEKLEQDNPPDLLDQAILNSAHRAVQKKPRWMQFGWPHGLTTAAVFVLAFSLVLNQREPVPVDEALAPETEPVRLQQEMLGQDIEAQTAPAARMERSSVDTAGDALRARKAAAPAKQEPGQPLPSSDILAEIVTLQKENTEPREDDARQMVIDADFAAAAGVLESRRTGETLEVADNEAEQELARILELKQAGDETWKAALQEFREQYPDHPLPAELED